MITQWREIGILCISHKGVKWYSHCVNYIAAPQKFSTKLQHDPAILPLGIYSKDFKGGTQRSISTPMFRGALFTISKRWKQPKCSSRSEQINKMWYIQTMEH